MFHANFQVAHLSHVKQQILDLTALAALAGIKQQFLARFRATIQRLQHRPWKVGEQLYRTRYPGGVVYKVTRSPFIIEFVLYERERQVLVLNVKPFPLAFSK